MSDRYDNNTQALIDTLFLEDLSSFHNEFLAHFKFDDILQDKQTINMTRHSSKTTKSISNDKNKCIELAHKNFQQFLLSKMDGLAHSESIVTAKLYDQLPALATDGLLYARIVAMEYLVLAKDGAWTPYAGMFSEGFLVHSIFKPSIRRVDAAITTLTSACTISTKTIALRSNNPEKNLLVFSYSCLLTIRDNNCIQCCFAKHVWKNLRRSGLTRQNCVRGQLVIDATIHCWYEDWQIKTVYLDVDLHAMYKSYTKV